jgi:hypothetical protein
MSSYVVSSQSSLESPRHRLPVRVGWQCGHLPTLAATFFFIFFTTGCAALFAPPGPDMNSFLGVNFGDEFTDVQKLYPQALPETSPYGAATLRMDNVSRGGVVYDVVLFEFLWRGGGMELAIARFKPASARAIREKFQGILGPPIMRVAVPSSQLDQAQLAWTLYNGGRVEFDGKLGQLVIIGPRGKLLEDDVKAREKHLETPSG